MDAATAAAEWLAQDPDAETRDQLAKLLARVSSGDMDAAAELADRFNGRLAFGTAGLRGELGAGSNRMNRVLVAQAAAGFAAYLLERAGGGAGAGAGGGAGSGDSVPSVVIGYDGRKNSRVFATDSAEIFAGAGLRAILLPRLLPTPVLAFAVRHLGAAAGVMVTASHNPPNDNGYKVYLGGPDEGSQIVSPADAEIAAHIARVGSVAELPRSLGYEIADEAVIDDYVAATASISPSSSSALSWVYTAMHGVGWETLSRIVSAAGYAAPTLVDEQIEPDAAFPTVAFPNPEEPGAMDLALETARRSNADLVIANDPDADRLAVAIPADVEGGWRSLTGNEVGLLLGWRAARRVAEGLVGSGSAVGLGSGLGSALASGASPDNGFGGASLACSLVSSPGLRAVAEHFGLDFHETLTGFKWISRAPGIQFGFEEALGYLVNPETVRDKDGISAAVAMLGMATEAYSRGSSIAGLLEEFGATFGHFASAQVSIRVEDVAIISRIMGSLRADMPATLGEVDVSSVDDLLTGVDGFAPSDVLRLWLGDGSRVIVRPSGTEPKLKAYLDVRGSSAVEASERLGTLEAAVRVLLDARG